jgi:hypothetical protein
MALEGGLQATYQGPFLEGLGQKANGSSAPRAYPEPLFGESGDEDDRDAAALSEKPALQIKARQTRHLHIANQARSLRKAPGFQKPLGGLEGRDRVPQRFDEVAERLSDEIVVIDNGNHARVPRNHGLSLLNGEKADSVPLYRRGFQGAYALVYVCPLSFH